PATVALLLAGWLFTPAPLLWSGLIAGLMLWPVLNSLLGLLLHPPPPGTRFWRDPRDRLLRSMFAVIFLADYAGMALDAIARVAYRRLRSHRLLLEWETALDAHQRARSQQRQFVLSRLWIPAACVLLFAAAGWRGPTAMVAVGPFLLLSALFPVAVMVIDRPAKSWRGGILTANDRRFLRTAARRTWRYFDDFVGPQTSWLPPDNVQETPKREIFLRTSPTNIGLWILATVAANDFGYITIDDLVARNLGTLETLGLLERFEGHLFNWYDLSTLEPLHPRYVSTVDSGNLLASLWTFESSCDELAARPLLDAGALRGIADTLGVLGQIAATLKEMERPPAFLRLAELTTGQPADLEEIILRVREARQPAQDLLLHYRGHETDPRAYWAQQISTQVAAWTGVIDKYLRPVEILMSPPAQLNELVGQSQQLEDGMGLRFLYDEERRIFAIGYQVAERRLDSSFYDLLASEARLTSFLAIARGEVPVEHWWALSRPFGSAYG